MGNMFKFPDSGQIRLYDRNAIEVPNIDNTDPLSGQDGNFVFNPMKYVKLDESGNELKESATWETGYRIAKDCNTGLMWEIKSPVPGDINYCSDRYDFDKMQSEFIEKLNKNKYCGFDDWRIPNKDELRSIIDYGQSNPAVDTYFFPNTQIDLYYCNNTYKMQPYFGWAIFFGLGSATAVGKENAQPVRAVRGGYAENYGVMDEARFTDNGDGTISDSLTGLMWQKGENSRMSWYDALENVKKLDLAGHTDWRLPNIKELNTILNLKYTDSWWYFKKFFPADGLEPPLLHYYTSSVHENYYAWVTNFCFGYDGYYANKNAPLLHRGVRNIEKPAIAEKSFKMPDTGQIKLFNDEGGIIPEVKKGKDFYGQDGTFITNPQSFTKLRTDGYEIPKDSNWDEGLRMIKDNNTGLIWEIKSPNASDYNYCEKKYTFDDAKKFIEELNNNNHAGFSDWRLPNREELRTIVQYDGIYPAIDKEYFPTIKPAFYWSSVPYGADPKMIWGIYFAYGCGICYLNKVPYYAIAVRGGFNQSFGDPEKMSFTDNNDGTITDNVTGLMWKKEESPELIWKDALKYCEDLNLAGHSDWRMPNQRELATLLNMSFSDNLWYQKDFFPDTKIKPLGFYWSSSTFAGTFAWGINFQFGYDGYYGGKKHGKYPFRPVRNT